MLIDRKRVQQPRSREQGMVSRRQHGRHDDGVDKAPSRSGAGHLEDKSEGGSSRILIVQTGGSVGDVEAENKDREDIEKKDAEKNVADDAGQSASRVFGLAGCYCNRFGASVCD